MNPLVRKKSVDVNLRQEITKELKGVINECCDLYLAHDPRTIQAARMAQVALEKIIANTEITLQTDKELERIRESIREVPKEKHSTSKERIEQK